jgi:hypothetical protein
VGKIWVGGVVMRTMRRVNMTADDLKPCGCKLMNLQSEARHNASNGSKLSLLLPLLPPPLLPPPALFMTMRAVMQAKELLGRTG